MVAALFAFTSLDSEAQSQTIQDYLGWSEGRRIGYVQGWFEGVYHASINEDVLEPYRTLPGGGWVGTPRSLSNAYLDLIECHDMLWEYVNDMAADLAGYLARRMNAPRRAPPSPTDTLLITHVPRFFREACSDFR